MEGVRKVTKPNFLGKGGRGGPIKGRRSPSFLLHRPMSFPWNCFRIKARRKGKRNGGYESTASRENQQPPGLGRSVQIEEGS